MSKENGTEEPKMRDFFLLCTMVGGSLLMFSIAGGLIGEWVGEGKSEEVQAYTKPVGILVGVLCWGLLVRDVVKRLESRHGRK